MKLYQLGLLFVFLIFSLYGCSNAEKNVTEPVSKTASASAPVPAQPDYVLDWKVNTENSLLSFVPEDTGVVLATPRRFDISKPGVQVWLDLIRNEMVDYINRWHYDVEDDLDSYKDALSEYESCVRNCEYSRRMAEADNREAEACDCVSPERVKALIEAKKKAAAGVEDLSLLLSDYSAHAAEWGLDPNGRMDAVFYLDRSVPVLKLTVQNEQKLKNKVLELFRNNLRVEWIEDDDEKEWNPDALSLVDKMPLVLNSHIRFDKPEKLVALGDSHEWGSEKIVSGQSEWWIIHSTLYNEHKEDDAVLAVNHTDGVLTLAYMDYAQVHEEYRNDLSSFLKVSDKPLKQADLGEVSDNAALAGYIDLHRLIDQVGHNSALENAVNLMMVDELGLDDDLTKEQTELYKQHRGTELVASLGVQGPVSGQCLGELHQILELYSRIGGQFRMDDDGSITLNSLLGIPDAQFMQSIRKLHTPYIPLQQFEAGIRIAVDLKTLYTRVMDYAKQKSEHSQCDWIRSGMKVLNSEKFKEVEKFTGLRSFTFEFSESESDHKERNNFALTGSNESLEAVASEAFRGDDKMVMYMPVEAKIDGKKGVFYRSDEALRFATGVKLAEFEKLHAQDKPLVQDNIFFKLYDRTSAFRIKKINDMEMGTTDQGIYFNVHIPVQTKHYVMKQIE